MCEMPYGSVQSANSTLSFDATTVSSLSDLSCLSPAKQSCQSRTAFYFRLMNRHLYKSH